MAQWKIVVKRFMYPRRYHRVVMIHLAVFRNVMHSDDRISHRIIQTNIGTFECNGARVVRNEWWWHALRPRHNHAP